MDQNQFMIKNHHHLNHQHQPNEIQTAVVLLEELQKTLSETYKIDLLDSLINGGVGGVSGIGYNAIGTVDVNVSSDGGDGVGGISYSRNDIETITNIKVNALKLQYLREEEIFVEHMLQNNPIKYERRRSKTITTTTINQTKNNENYDNDDSSNCDNYDEINNIKNLEKLKRSESCRRSRLNNKIKNAKIQYKTTFLNNKLDKSKKILQCVHKIIERIEDKLIDNENGYNRELLDDLRKKYGISKSIDIEEMCTINTSTDDDIMSVSDDQSTIEKHNLQN